MRVRRRPVLVVVGLLVVGATLVTVLAVLAARERQRKDAVAQAQGACSSAYDAALSLRTGTDAAEDLLAATDGQVADQSVRARLSATLTQARQLSGPRDVPVADPRRTVANDAGAARAADRACRQTKTAADAAVARLTDASAAARLSNAQFLLTAAQAEATTTIEAADALNTEADGQVTDPATRDALSAALAAAAAARDVTPAATIEGLAAQRNALTAAVSAIAPAQQAVADSRATWQAAEDARAAAVQRPAPKAPKPTTPKSTAPKPAAPKTTTPKSTTPKSTMPSAPLPQPGRNAPPPPAPGGGRTTG